MSVWNVPNDGEIRWRRENTSIHRQTTQDSAPFYRHTVYMLEGLYDIECVVLPIAQGRIGWSASTATRGCEVASAGRSQAAPMAHSARIPAAQGGITVLLQGTLGSWTT